MTVLTSKKCISCGEEKLLTDYYKHPQMADGRLGKCKECQKRDVKKSRYKNADYYREFDRVRQRAPARQAKHQERMAEYRKSGKLAEYSDAWKDRNPKKVKVYKIVAAAVACGQLVREPCQLCGVTNAHAHHHDYDKPLDAHWLCPACHSAEHVRIRDHQRVQQLTGG